MPGPPRIFRFSLKGRFKVARYPLVAALLLAAFLFAYMDFGTWKFWLLLVVALFLALRSAMYMFAGKSGVVIADEGIERDGRVAPFDGAKVTLRTKKEGEVSVVQDVLVEGPALSNGTVPSVVFDQSLQDFAAAVQAVLIHIPDSNVQVLAQGEPELTAEQKDAVLAPFRGDPVQRALAQLGRPGAMGNIPPHLRN